MSVGARINNIIIHCSDSGWGCAREIRKWHLQRGFSDIGYHNVIQNAYPVSGFYFPPSDGHIEHGRYLDDDMFLRSMEQGAHALGYNANSLGICLVGKAQFTPKQWASLRDIVWFYTNIFNIHYDNVLGHYETESGKAQGKTCPNFDVQILRDWLNGKEVVWP